MKNCSVNFYLCRQLILHFDSEKKYIQLTASLRPRANQAIPVRPRSPARKPLLPIEVSTN